MTNEWDDMASFWDNHEDVIEYSQKAFKSLEHTIDIKNKRILDFGCGSGLLTEKIAKKANEVFAIDSSSVMISVLDNKKIVNVKTCCDELSDVFIKEHQEQFQKFDIIVASSVCAFVDDYPKLLILIKQLLKPNGIFIQWDWLASEYRQGEGFDLKTIKTTYDNVGFSSIGINYDFSLKDKKVVKAVGINPID